MLWWVFSFHNLYMPFVFFRLYRLEKEVLSDLSRLIMHTLFFFNCQISKIFIELKNYHNRHTLMFSSTSFPFSIHNLTQWTALPIRSIIVCTLTLALIFLYSAIRHRLLLFISQLLSNVINVYRSYIKYNKDVCKLVSEGCVWIEAEFRGTLSIYCFMNYFDRLSNG